MGQLLLELGQQEEALKILKRLLRRRFGELPESMQAMLTRLSVAQLEELLDGIVTVNSLEEFMASIPAAENDSSDSI